MLPRFRAWRTSRAMDTDDCVMPPHRHHGYKIDDMTEAASTCQLQDVEVRRPPLDESRGQARHQRSAAGRRSWAPMVRHDDPGQISQGPHRRRQVIPASAPPDEIDVGGHPLTSSPPIQEAQSAPSSPSGPSWKTARSVRCHLAERALPCLMKLRCLRRDRSAGKAGSPSSSTSRGRPLDDLDTTSSVWASGWRMLLLWGMPSRRHRAGAAGPPR